MSERIRVLLVDDHQVVREGLRRMLELEPDIEVVGEAGDISKAISMVKSHLPDVVLMDIKMPNIDGIEATRLLRKAQPGCRVIMLTLYEEYVSEALQAGAAGYLLKDVKRGELSQAIRVALHGQVPFNAALAHKLVTKYTSVTEEGPDKETALTERQKGMVKLIASGANNGQIATELAVSETTVRREMHALYTKLGVASRARAVAEALKRKLV